MMRSREDPFFGKFLSSSKIGVADFVSIKDLNDLIDCKLRIGAMSMRTPALQKSALLDKPYIPIGFTPIVSRERFSVAGMQQGDC